MGHAHESVAECVALRAGNHFDRQVAFGNRHGNAGHFLEVGHHVVESGCQSADFVVTVDINVLVEIAGVTDFACDSHEVLQWFADGARGVERYQHTGYKREQSAADGQKKADVTGSIR